MLIFLYGEDRFRISGKLVELKNKFLREVDPGGSNLLVLDGEKAKLEEIHGAIAPAALFSKKRMVIIENIFLNKNPAIHAQLAELLKKIRDDKDANILVFRDEAIDEKKISANRSALFGLLAGQKYSHRYKQLNIGETIRWARNKAQQSGFRIRHDALERLVEAAGNDLWRLDNEIDKLIAYKLSAGQPAGGEIMVIGLEDVVSLVGGKIESGIFALTDALGNHNSRLAAALLESQLDSGAQDNYLLAMIIRQFKILLQVKVALAQGMSSRKIASYLKLHPFAVQKCLTQVKQYDEPVLRGLIGRLVEAEYKMKSGLGDARLDLSILVSSI